MRPLGSANVTQQLNSLFKFKLVERCDFKSFTRCFHFKNKLVKCGHKVSQEIFTPNEVKQRSLNVLGKNWDEE